MKRSLVVIGLVAAVCLAQAAEAGKFTNKRAYKKLVAASAAEESNQYLIELSGSGPGDLAAAVAAAGGTLVRQMPEIAAASAVSDAKGFAKALAKTKGIQRVTRDLMVQWIPGAEAFDPETHEGPGGLGHIDPNLAFFRPCQWNIDQINAPGAWAQGEFGGGSTVAILDTGVDPFHQELAGKIDPASASVLSPGSSPCGPVDEALVNDFDSHGTFVASVAAANSIDMAGVAPHASVVGVKVLNCFGFGSFSDVIAGILYAASLPQVDVINMSLGAYFPKNLPGAGPLLAAQSKAINFAQGVSGKLVVSSAGNQGVDLDKDGNFVHLPSQAGSGTSAWAGDIFGGLAGYSNHGLSGADYGAGGGDFPYFGPPLAGCVLPPILQGLVFGACSTTSIFFFCPGGVFYLIGAGTSFSAPAVTGVGGLAAGKFPAKNGNQLKTHLKNTADDIGKKGADNLFSHGRVNANNAVQ